MFLPYDKFTDSLLKLVLLKSGGIKLMSTSNIAVGILTKQDIADHINRSALILNANRSRIQSCSYDMCIGTVFQDGQVYNASHPKANDQFILQPGEFISFLLRKNLIFLLILQPLPLL